MLTMNVSAQDSLKTKSKTDSIVNKQLNEVVISASRSERNVNEVGRSISIITSDDIKKSGANSIAEVLSQQEGIYMVGAGQNPGMTSSIFTRGANSNQTVIMVDGMRITDPSAINNSIDVAELALVNIDRIEIVRGSHSTMYGSSAIGGVVNIITKKVTKPGLTLDIYDTEGSFGKGTQFSNSNIYAGYALKNGIYFSAEGANEKTKGLNATVDTVTRASTYQHKDLSDGFNKWDANVKAGFINKKLDVYASYKYTQQQADIDKSAYTDDDNYTVNFHRDLFTYGAKFKISDKFNLNYTGGYSVMKRISINDSSLVDNNNNYNKMYDRSIYSGKLISNELQANYATKGLNVVLGGGANSESMTANTLLYYLDSYNFFPPQYNSIETSSDSVNPHSSTANIFLHTDIGGELISEKIKAFTLSGGLRMTNHNVFGTNVTYEINPSVKIMDGGLLYATYATGYNAPSLYQLYDASRYYTWDNNSTTGLTLGNKKLKPEESKTIEVGFKQHFNNITLSATYFQTEVKNVIEYVYLWDKNIGIDTLGQGARDDYRGETYLNLGTMKTEGIELGFSSKLGEKCSVSGNLSLVTGKLYYHPDDIDTTQTRGNHVQLFNNGAFINKEVEITGLTRRPNTANLSLTYKPIKKLSLRADMRHAGARSDVFYDSSLPPYGALGTVGVEPYTLLDLSAHFDIFKGLSAMLRVENVFDEKYSEIKGYTTRGRGVYFTLRCSL